MNPSYDERPSSRVSAERMCSTLKRSNVGSIGMTMTSPPGPV
jgi:hypothetical protein